jgi:hypothetical protein
MFVRFATILSALALVALNGCDQPSSGRVVVIGDIQKVLGGKCSPRSFKRVDSADVLAAMGVATLDRRESAGEMICLFGRTFIKSTDPASRFATRETAATFRTPYALLLRRDQMGAGQVVRNLDEMTLTQLVQREVPSGAVIALVRCVEVQGDSLRRPPIFGDRIRAKDNRGTYFHPTRGVFDKWAMLFGVIVGPDDAHTPATEGLLDAGLRFDPQDPKSTQIAGSRYRFQAAILRRRPPGATTLDAIAAGMSVEEVLELRGISRVAVEQMIIFPHRQ